MNSSGRRVYRTSPGRLVVLALFLVLLVIGQQLVSLPGTLLGATVQNALHIPAYAGLTVLLAFCFPRLRWLGLVGISLVVGVGIEVSQSFTGRDGDLLDICRNLLGTGLAAGIMRGPGTWMQRWAVGGSLLLTLTLSLPLWVWLAYQHRDAIFPQLLDANDWPQSPLLYSNSPLKRVDLPPGARENRGLLPAAGDHGLRLCFADVEIPGVHLNEVVGDWRAYRWLNLSLMVPGTRAVDITVSINHWGSPVPSAFVSREFDPGWHHWRVPLDSLLKTAVGGTAEIGKLILHGDRKKAGDCLIVERVWLDG